MLRHFHQAPAAVKRRTVKSGALSLANGRGEASCLTEPEAVSLNRGISMRGGDGVRSPALPSRIRPARPAGVDSRLLKPVGWAQALWRAVTRFITVADHELLTAKMASHLAEEVLQASTDFDGTERAPMRNIEARITLGVIAARQGDVEQAVHYSERPWPGRARPCPLLPWSAEP
jgi:hypothetical protein